MDRFEFHSNAVGFDPINLRWLCEAASLVSAGDLVAARRTLEGWGLPRFVWFSQRETEAFLAGNANLILIAFRGLGGEGLFQRLLREPQRFVETPLGRVDEFFWREFTWIRANLAQTVRAFRDAKQPVWLTGHGLGGALAVLAAGWLASEQVFPVQGLATFGAPRVGHREYAVNFHQLMDAESRSFQRSSMRVVNHIDPISQLPPTSRDYAAIGHKVHFDEHGEMIPCEGTGFERMAELVSAAKIAVDRALDGQPVDLSDHAISEYLRHTRHLAHSAAREPR